MAAASGDSSFDLGGFFTSLINTGAGAWSDYNKTQQSYAQAKAEQAKADKAQQEYQATSNLLGMEKSKITMIAIAVGGALLALILVFRK